MTRLSPTLNVQTLARWLPKQGNHWDALGFTLSELLIALAILGIIAAFTIPKILSTQQDQKYNSAAKEAAASISDAFQQYSRVNSLSSTVDSTNLTPYFNYVQYDTSSTIDGVYTVATNSCSAGSPCLLLHNGGRLLFINAPFGGTATTNALWFMFDPDGQVTDGTTNGPGKAVEFLVYYNGRIVSADGVLAGSSSGGVGIGPMPGRVPPWFSW